VYDFSCRCTKTLTVVNPKTATIDCWSNFCLRTKDHALIEKWLEQENPRLQFERLLFLATTCFVDGKSSWPENEDFLTGFFSNPFCKQVWSNAAFLQKTDDFWRKMAIVFKSVPENHFARFLEKSGFQTLNSIGTNLDALIPWHAIERSVFCDPGFSLESQKKFDQMFKDASDCGTIGPTSFRIRNRGPFEYLNIWRNRQNIVEHIEGERERGEDALVAQKKILTRYFSRSTYSKPWERPSAEEKKSLAKNPRCNSFNFC